jgi:hypothetical protein
MMVALAVIQDLEVGGLSMQRISIKWPNRSNGGRLKVPSDEVKMKKICLPQMGVGCILICWATLALAGLFCAPHLHAEIYQWIDENGVKHYSNSPPGEGKDVKKVSGEYRFDEAADQERFKSDQRTVDRLTEEIETEARKAQVQQQDKLLEQEQKEPVEADKKQSHLLRSECFGPSYSVQQGRGAFEAVIPRELSESEYHDLQELFGSLDGKWAGNARVIVCQGSPDDIRKAVDTYSVESEGKMFSTSPGKRFYLETILYSGEKRESHQENFHFYLDSKKLALAPDISTSDIELISISPDKLVYVKNWRPGGERGAYSVRETLVAIEKTGNASFLLERLNYYNGILVAVDNWQLRNK